MSIEEKLKKLREARTYLDYYEEALKDLQAKIAAEPQYSCPMR